MDERSIRNLRVDRREAPVGISGEAPLFSFLSDYCGAHTVRVTDENGEEYASRTVESGEEIGFRFPCRFESGRVYFWQVKNGRAESEIARFETGEELTAPVLTPEDESVNSPVFFRRFFCPEDLHSARLTVAALGLYRAFLNRKRVGEDYLTPGVNDYGSFVRSETYDVGELLIPGQENLLEIAVGNGWYRGRYGIDKPVDRGDRVYGERYLLSLKLTVKGESGAERMTLVSDDSFRVHRSTCLSDSIYDGEVRDYTRDAGKESGVRYASFPGKVLPWFGAPIREVDVLKPVLYRSPAGEQILDFGQNMVGFVRFRYAGTYGQKVRLQHGEVLQKGCFYRGNLRTARAEAVYILDGKERVYEPYFTFFGFRYVKVEGIDEVNPDDFSGVVLSSATERVSECRTSDGRIDRLIENTLWGQRGNFLDLPTDCPQRDERLGWTADAQIFSKTACFQFDSYAFYRKYLRDLREEQVRRYGGDLPMYAPSLNGEAGHGGAVWSDCATILPWNLYLFYGDRDALAEDYEMMRDYCDYLIREEEKTGGNGLLTEGFTFGDWLAADGISGNSLKGGTDPTFIRTVYYRHSLVLTARAAEVLGKTGDASRYLSAGERVKKALLESYVTPGGRLAADTQTSYVLSLTHGIYRDRRVIVSSFRERLRKDLYRMKTGFVGTPLLLPCLFDAGMQEDAYRILFSETCPGWLYEVNLGATTVWERWNSLLPDGTISGESMNSLNHYAYGSVCEAIYSRIAGLRPLSPGFRRVRVRPYPDYRMRAIDFLFISPAGEYRVGWEIRDDGIFLLRLSVPAGGECEVLLPDGEFLPGSETEQEVGGGFYTYLVRPKEDFLHPFSLSTPNCDILSHPGAREVLQDYLPSAYRILNGENEEFLAENGYFFGEVKMFGVSEADLYAYEAALKATRG